MAFQPRVSKHSARTQSRWPVCLHRAHGDDIDEIVFSAVDKYGETDLKAVNKGAAGDDLKGEAEPEKAESLKPLLEKIKATLGDAVKEVRISTLLADSPSVIVSDEDEPSARMRQMMQAMGQKTSRAATHARDQPRLRDHYPPNLTTQPYKTLHGYSSTRPFFSKASRSNTRPLSYNVSIASLTNPSVRCLPSVVDGLQPSQRCFQLRGEMLRVTDWSNGSQTRAEWYTYSRRQISNRLGRKSRRFPPELKKFFTASGQE